MIRIAAAGDVHASEPARERIVEAFARVQDEADIILLAGDQTTTGEHAGKGEQVAEILREGNVNVLEGETIVCDLNDIEVGVVGTKGFVGGFPGSALADFGEPALRQLYAETSAEVDALARGLVEISFCALRIVLLHYSPTADTLLGEPEGIWTYLGCDRLAAPIAEYRPDVVLHGHAHAGSFEGAIGPVPVYNVAVHVTGRDFYVFELGPHEVEVETPV